MQMKSNKLDNMLFSQSQYDDEDDDGYEKE